MADTKLSALTTALAALADLVYIVDVSDTTDDPAGSSRGTTFQSALDSLGVPYSKGGASITEDSGGNVAVVTGSGSKLTVSSGGSTGAVILLNDTSGTHQACRFQFQRNGTFKWQFGTDLNNNDGDNFFIFDQANSSTRLLVIAGGTTAFDGGHVVMATDNTYDNGASGATRTRSLYLGTSLELESQAWVRNHPGRKRTATAPTNATNTLSSGLLSDLSVTLVGGKKYTGRVVFIAKNSTGAEGLQFDFNGGTATMTNFQATLEATPIGATVGVSNGTALATALTNTAVATTDAVFAYNLTLVANAGGTFIPRFAENSAHTSGTATVEIGSYLWLEDTA